MCGLIGGNRSKAVKKASCVDQKDVAASISIKFYYCLYQFTSLLPRPQLCQPLLPLPQSLLSIPQLPRPLLPLIQPLMSLPSLFCHCLSFFCHCPSCTSVFCHSPTAPVSSAMSTVSSATVCDRRGWDSDSSWHFMQVINLLVQKKNLPFASNKFFSSLFSSNSHINYLLAKV